MDNNSQRDKQESFMPTAAYRIESSQPIAGRLWPAAGAQQYVVKNRALAVSLAAKSFTSSGQEIRVVHVPSGEVVFRKAGARRSEWSSEDL
jgi:hypothetical protein